MGNPLDDLANLGKGAFDAVANVGNDAAEAIDRATRNTAALAGSGFNGREVIGPLGDKLGRDPGTFVLNLARETRATARKLCERVAERTQRLSYTVQTPKGPRKIAAKPPSKANATQIALTLVLAAMDAPAVMAEEAGRMANGLPVKERGLTGYTIYPFGLNASPTDGEKQRGLFGIDDAALLAIVVPILVAIAANVLPLLISAASNVLSDLTQPKGPSPEEQQAAQKAQEEKEQQSMMITIAVVAGVVLVGAGAIFFVIRKKKPA